MMSLSKGACQDMLERGIKFQSESLASSSGFRAGIAAHVRVNRFESTGNWDDQTMKQLRSVVEDPGNLRNRG